MTSRFSAFAAQLRKEFFSDKPGIEHVSGRDTEADRRFNALSLELFSLQFTANPAYRRVCESRKLGANNVEHWTQIPAMPASAFKQFDVSCLPHAQRATMFHSSGTTDQQPSRHFHSIESLNHYDASLWPWFRAHVIPEGNSALPGFRLIALTPPPAHAPNSSLVHMVETVRRKLGAPISAFVGRTSQDGAWTLDFDAALAALNPKFEARLSRRSGAKAEDPKLILSTAFSMVHLADYLAAHRCRFQLPPGSRVMETGGYKGRSRTLPKTELHALITHTLGVPASHIVCEYGMSELSSQAYDAVSGVMCQASDVSSRTTHRTFLFPPWVRAQVISPETGREVAEGETGLLRIFDLANVWSVMAIQTEDLAVRRSAGFELVGRAIEAEPRGCSLMTVES